jgi:hypothetical protein
VDETGNDFLAGAFVATDQYAGARLSRLTDAFQDHAHGRVVTNQASPSGLLAQGAAGSLLQHAPNDRDGQVMVERTRQEFRGACAKGREYLSGSALASQGDNRNPRLASLRSGYHLRSTVRETQVQDA